MCLWLLLPAQRRMHPLVYVALSTYQVLLLVQVWVGEVEGVKTTFLEPTSGAFWVGCIYGRNDDAARFGFFCGAAVEYLKHHAGQLCVPSSFLPNCLL